jgi:hypothetical protein
MERILVTIIPVPEGMEFADIDVAVSRALETMGTGITTAFFSTDYYNVDEMLDDIASFIPEGD